MRTLGIVVYSSGAQHGGATILDDSTEIDNSLGETGNYAFG